MAVRKSEAIWEGTLKEGRGTMKLGSGAYEGAYTYASRFEEGPGTNPEELIGAAHAGCFSMFLGAQLATAGFPARRIHTTATVHLEAGPTIARIELDSEAEVPGIDESTFMDLADKSKANCPVSKALASVPDVVLNIRLIQ